MGKSRPTEHQMDTSAINHEEVEFQKVLFLERKRKEQGDGRKRQRAARRKRSTIDLADDHYSGITSPVESSAMSLLTSTLGEKLAEYNSIEEQRLKVQEEE